MESTRVLVSSELVRAFAAILRVSAPSLWSLLMSGRIPAKLRSLAEMLNRTSSSRDILSVGFLYYLVVLRMLGLLKKQHLGSDFLLLLAVFEAD